MASSALNTGGVPARMSSVPIRNIWHMLLYAWNEVPIRQYLNVDVDQSPSLDALLATILASLMQQRLRIGLGRSYINEEQLIRGIRGRVDFNESIKRMAFQSGRAYCRFQSFMTNAPKNQIIRSTLIRLVQTGNFGQEKSRAEELRQKLRKLVRNLDGVDLIEVSPAFIRRQNLGRNDADYRLMLAICDLLLQRQIPTEQPGSTRLIGLDRDTLVLYKIFERFIANFYRFHLKKWFVKAQHSLQWDTAKTSQFLPAMVVDLLLRSRNDDRLIILDTKFTADILLEGRWEKLLFDSSHLYQMYSYLRSQEHLSKSLRSAAGIILYPTAKWHLSQHIDVQGHLIRFETIDLSESWKMIEVNLLKLIPDDIAANYTQLETSVAAR